MFYVARTLEAKAKDLLDGHGGIRRSGLRGCRRRFPTRWTWSNRGHVKVGADLGMHLPTPSPALYSVSGTVAMALISAGLFIGSSLLATRRPCIPSCWAFRCWAVLGYVGAFVLGAYVVWRNIAHPSSPTKNEEGL